MTSRCENKPLRLTEDGLGIWAGHYAFSSEPYRLTKGDDNFRGGRGPDNVLGLAGNDRLDGEQGSDVLRGGAGNDMIYADKGNDVLRGGTGVDTVSGEDDDDLVTGGSGNDLLSGGLGADVLYGGSGADRIYCAYDFRDDGRDKQQDIIIYTSIADSTRDERDSVYAFDVTRDLFDLSAIDADVSTAADDAFRFIGRDAFSGSAGELRAFADGTGFILQGDINGDAQADFEVEVSIHHGKHILITDFVL